MRVLAERVVGRVLEEIAANRAYEEEEEIKKRLQARENSYKQVPKRSKNR